MLNNANKALGYTEVYYNYNSKLFFTDNLGSQFLELDIKTGENDNGNDGTALQPGDNVSQLTNDAGYLVSGDNISVLNNDAGYLTSYTETSDLQAVTDRGAATTNDISIGRLNANHVGVPVVSSLPTSNMLFGDICALNTNNRPYFYDGTDWRELYLVGVPNQPGPPDPDWDRVLMRMPYNTNFIDVKNDVNSNIFTAEIVGSPSKFGGGSARIQGTGFIRYDNQSSWLEDEFTIEFWIYVDTLSWNVSDTYSETIIFQKNGFELGLTSDENNLNLRFYAKLPGQDRTLLAGRPSQFDLQEWVHIAYCRNKENGRLRLFVNGIYHAENDLLNDFNDTPSVIDFGGNSSIPADYFIDDVRISNFERYTSDFPVPTAELPTNG